MDGTRDRKHPQAAEVEDAPGGVSRFPAWRKPLVLALWIGLAAVGLVGGLFVVVQADPISTFAGRWVAGLVSSDRLRLQVDRVTGNWVRNLTLTGLRVSPGAGPDTTAQGGWALSADTLTFRYAFFPLVYQALRHTIAIREVDGSGVALRIQRAPATSISSGDSTGTTGGSGSGSAWKVRVGAAGLRGVRLDMDEGPSAGGAGVWTLSEARVRGRDLRVGPGLTLTLDTLAGTFRPPGKPENWGEIRASGRLERTALRIDTLLLRSPESHLAARGVAPLTLQKLVPEELDLRFAARPLALRDVGPFLPRTVADSIRLEADGFALTVNDTVRVSFRAESGSSGRIVAEGAVAGEKTAPRVEARVLLEGIDLHAWGLSGRPLSLEGNVEAHLRGPRGRTTGSARLDATLRDRRSDRLVHAGAEALSDSSGRSWRGEWSVDTRGLSLQGDADLAPEAGPTWSVSGRTSYARDEGGPAPPSLDLAWLRGSFHVEGEGRTLDSMRARGEVRVDSARVGRGNVGATVVTGRVEGGRAVFSLEGEAGGGSVEARGEVDLLARTAHLVESRLRDLDAASLVGDTVSSEVNAMAAGRILSTSPLRATGSLTLLESRYGGLQVDSAAAELDTRGQSTSFRVRIAFPDSARAWAGGRFERGSGTERLVADSLGYSHLDARVLARSTDSNRVPFTALNGRATASAVRTAEGWSGQADVQLDSSVVGSQVIRSARLAARVDSSRARLDLDLRTPAGGIAGQAQATGLGKGQVRTVSLSDVRFKGLDPGAALEGGRPFGTFSGTLEGQVRGNELKEMTGRVQAVLDSSTVAGVGLESATLHLRLDAGTLEASVQAAVGEDGTASAEATADLTGSVPSYHSQGALHLPRLDASGPAGRGLGFLFARYEVDGRGLRLDSIQGRASLDVDSAGWAGVSVDGGRLRMALAGGELTLDTLLFQSSVGTLSGGGSLPVEAGSGREGKLWLHGEVERSEGLDSLVGAEVFALGSAVVDASAQGAVQDVHLEVSTRIGALLWNSVRVQGLDLNAQAHRTRGDGVTEASGDLGVDRLRLPQASIRRMDVRVALEPGDELAISASADIDDLRRARLAAHVEGMWAASAVRVDTLEFQADQDHWSLTRPSRITFRDGLTIDSLHVAAQGQEILATGRVGRQGPLSLHVFLSSFDVATVADLLGYPDLTGNLTGSMALDGTAESPTLDAGLEARLDPNSSSPVDLTVNAKYEPGKMTVKSKVSLGDGRGADLSAALPFGLSLAGPSRGLLRGQDVEIVASADSLSLGWAAPLFPSSTVRGLEGVLDGSVRIQGPTDGPSFDGAMNLVRASAGIPSVGVRYEVEEARLTFRGDGIQVDSLRVRTGDGSLAASGSVHLSPLDAPEFDLTLRAHSFQAVNASYADAMVSGEVRLTGSVKEPSLSGRIELEEGDLFLGDIVGGSSVQDVTLTEADYREMAQVFGYRPGSQSSGGSNLFEALSLDLNVQLRRDSWIRQRSSPQVAIQFTGQVSIKKEPGGAVQLLGTVEGIPAHSYVEQFGRRFSLASGTLTFRGDPGSTQVDLRAEYDVPSRDSPDAPQVVIALAVSGTPGDLNLELSSTPPLEASDMVSYIVTGRPASRSLSGGSGETSLSQAGGELALSQVSSAVEAYAREQVGLDVVEVTTDGLNGVTLVAGRYLSPSLYLGIRQPVALQRSAGDASQRTPAPRIEVELEAVRWLLLNLQAGGQGDVKFFVRSRIAYD